MLQARLPGALCARAVPHACRGVDAGAVDGGDDGNGGGGGDGADALGGEEFMQEGMEGLQVHMNQMLQEAAEQHALAANHGGNVQASPCVHAPLPGCVGELLVNAPARSAARVGTA